MAGKQGQRISGELNSVSVQGRSAITQALSSYNSGGYDVRIQIRPRQLRRRGMAPSPYQTLYLNPEDQDEALAEEKVTAAREQKPLQEAQERGETTVRIGQEHVCPTYVLTGLEQTQDAPILQVPLGETASAAHRARRLELEQALRELGYDLDTERERRRAMDAIPIAWSQEAKHVLIGDGNLGAFGQNGYLSRSTASIGLPEIRLTQLLDLLPLLCKFFPRADTFVLVGGAADWLKMPASHFNSTSNQIVDDSLELCGQLWAPRGWSTLRHRRGCVWQSCSRHRPQPTSRRGGLETSPSTADRWWRTCKEGNSCLCRTEWYSWHHWTPGRCRACKTRRR